jgi:hypothetical protein
MEGMVKHDEIVSMQFFQTRKVIVNGRGFEISKDTIVRDEEFTMEGKNGGWRLRLMRKLVCRKFSNSWRNQHECV